MQYRGGILQLTIVMVVGFLAGACAPYQTLKGYDARPMTASMAPLGAVPEPRVAPSEEVEDKDDESAGALLERGFMHFHQQSPKEAAASFRGAIATGNLNDAGRALAYWHIAAAQRNLKDEDRTAEALSSFALVAQDIIDVREDHRFAVDTRGDFVDNFRLHSRVAEARGYVNALWARRSSGFGRSLDNPIVAASTQEVQYFAHFAACSEDGVSTIEHELLAPLDSEPPEFIRVERVTVVCNGDERGGQYFVVVPKP